MKLNVVDFSNPANLKDRTDGELYLLHHQERPSEHAPRRPTHQDRRGLGSSKLGPLLLQEGDGHRPEASVETVAMGKSFRGGGVILNAAAFQAERRACPERSRRDLRLSIIGPPKRTRIVGAPPTSTKKGSLEAEGIQAGSGERVQPTVQAVDSLREMSKPRKGAKGIYDRPAGGPAPAPSSSSTHPEPTATPATAPRSHQRSR
jgi:hypothetical protein